MKINTPVGRMFEESAIRRLKELLQGVPWLKDSSIRHLNPKADTGFDLALAVAADKGRKLELMVLCRQEVRPSLFPYVDLPEGFEHSRFGVSRYPVLAAPFIAPRMAEVCFKAGWGWFDLAGNCRISVPGLHIEKTGLPSVHRPPQPQVNLGTSHVARILRTLLVPVHAGKIWTQTAIAKEIFPTVSIGLVNKVIRFLLDEKHLEKTPDGGFRLIEAATLLNSWREAYRFDRHERRNFFTLMKTQELMAALVTLGQKSGLRAVYASFSAAEVQAPAVRSLKLWLYVDPAYEELFKTLTEAKPVDSGENLIVLFPADQGVFYQPEKVPGNLECTNPVQTYLDVFKSGSRGEEAAEAMLEQRLKPAWKT